MSTSVLLETKLPGSEANHTPSSSAEVKYRGADKSLARLGMKQAKVTEDFDVHISYLLVGDVVIKAPRYKPAGRGFDSRWCHLNFSVT